MVVSPLPDGSCAGDELQRYPGRPLLDPARLISEAIVLLANVLAQMPFQDTVKALLLGDDTARGSAGTLPPCYL